VPATEIHCDGDRATGWTCDVRVIENEREVSSHRVTVATTDLDCLDPDATDPTDLVERSFAFLLEREPPSSILRSFDLPVIGRYFPEYETGIRRRTSGT
jgi:hypothetical protein